MATRFYMTPGQLAATPAGLGAGYPTPHPEWDVVPSATTTRGRIMLVAPSSRQLYGGAASYTDAAGASGRDVMVSQHVSEPLKAQTIAGTFKGLIYAKESNAAANARAQVVVRVVGKDGGTVRGVLYAGDPDTFAPNANDEFGTSYVNKFFPRYSVVGGQFGDGSNPVPLTPVDVQDGDRIVIEFGVRAFTTGGYIYDLALNANLTNDAQNQNTTSSRGWFEFSQDFAFQGDGLNYFTDWSEYPNFVFPADWTTQFSSSTTNWQTYATSGAPALNMSGATANSRGLFKANATVSTDDDVTVRMKIGGTVMNVGPMISMPDTTQQFARGYVLVLQGTNAQIQLRRYTTDGITETATTLVTANNGFTRASSGWYWYRLKRTGDLIQAKTWQDAVAEPATWQVNYTDASPLPAGVPGLWGYNIATDAWWVSSFRRGVAVVAAPARAKRWNGSAWVDASIKRWDGSQWQTTTVKRWDGAAWV